MTRRVLSSLVLVMALMGAAAISRTAEAALPACAPAGSKPVNLLARPESGGAFATVLQEGGATPYLEPTTGRVIVPVRALVAVLSPGSSSVRWNAATRTATFVRGAHVLSFTFPEGSAATYSATVDGTSRSVYAEICNGTLYAPARFVAVALGAGIQWYEGGSVVVDPAWAGDAVRGHDPALPGSGRTDSAACESWPSGVGSWLTSPIRSTRQAARSTACSVFGGN